MSRKKRDLTQDEKALWRRVAANVKPRRPLPAEIAEAPPLAKDPAPKKPPPPKPPQRTLKPDAPAAAPPADRSGEKRVRRGKLEIDATLDLHGHTQDSARAALLRFLNAAYQRGDRVVVVVTGKGRAKNGEKGEGVLKRAFPDWLAARELKAILAGYAPAHRDHGGAGAFYVFLKARAE